MSGRQVGLILSAVLLIGGTSNNLHAALCQFNIGWDSRYTAYVSDSQLGTSRHAYITPLTATWKAGDDPTLSGLPKTFETYCIDLGNTLQSGQWWESGQFPNPNQPPGSPIWTLNGIYKAAWLYQTYSSDVSHGDATRTGAALQLAIWEVLYEDDPGYDVNNGTLRVYSGNSAFVNDGITGLANGYLQTLPALQPQDFIKGTWWNASTSAGTSTWSSNQDLIGPAPVPEPATYVAGGLLTLPFITTLLFRRLKS